MTIAAGYHAAVGHPVQVARAHLFFAWTGFLCLPLSAMLLAAYPVVLVFDPEKRTVLNWIQCTWARLTCMPFFMPEFVGLEHLQALDDQGCGVVYVSNHQSWADIYSLLCLPVPLRFVSKQQIFYIPVVGWCMGLIGHVGVSRGDRKSRASIVDTCVERVKSGVSVCLFAEGTRSRDGELQPFKSGAFLIASKAGASVVPVSITGTGNLMPPHRGETWLEAAEDAPVRVVVHPPLHAADFESPQALLERTRDLIDSGLKPAEASQTITGRKEAL